MSNFPDLSGYGYQILEQLHHSLPSQTIIYKAICFRTKTIVILKRKLSSVNPEDYEMIETFKQLNHWGIPRYLDSFHLGNQFYWVQEYQDAQPLFHCNQLTPQQIKILGVAILEILVYLQGYFPNIVDQTLNPDDILVAQDFNISLINVEEINSPNNLQSSAIYSLGMILMSLITSVSLENLEDVHFYQYEEQLSEFSPKFINWLEKMIAPNADRRFSSIRQALTSLKKNCLELLPNLQLSPENLEFNIDDSTQLLTQTITLINPVPNTLVEGYWEIEPHLNDPPHTPDKHEWISIFPRKFAGNRVTFTVTVKTQTKRIKLNPNKVHERILTLHSNSDQKIHTIKLRVEKKYSQTQTHFLSYFPLILSYCSSSFASVLIWGSFKLYEKLWQDILITLIFLGGWGKSSIILGGIWGATVGAILGNTLGSFMGIGLGYLLGYILGNRGRILSKLLGGKAIMIQWLYQSTNHRESLGIFTFLGTVLGASAFILPGIVVSDYRIDFNFIDVILPSMIFFSSLFLSFFLISKTSQDSVKFLQQKGLDMLQSVCLLSLIILLGFITGIKVILGGISSQLVLKLMIGLSLITSLIFSVFKWISFRGCLSRD